MRKLLTVVAMVGLSTGLVACKKAEQAATNDMAAEGPVADENVTTTANEVNTIDNVQSNTQGSTDHDI